MRKKYIIIIMVILFLASIKIYLYCQNNFLEVTEYEVINSRLPKDFNNFKIVQISDYHNTKSTKLSNDLIKEISNQKPNLIVITGDLIDANNTNIDIAINLIEDIKKIAPIYYVTGNHETWIDDYYVLKEELEENGVKVLENEFITINKGKSAINLIGIEDSNSVNEIQNKLINSNYQKDIFSILLSHRPELFDAYIKNEMDLVLTGHAHGGQIRIPFIGGLVAPNQGFFPKYSNGIYNKEKTTMIVSRGIGNSIISIRFNNHPELVVITLKNK